MQPYIWPSRNFFQSSIGFTKPFLDAQTEKIFVSSLMTRGTFTSSPVVITENLRHAEVGIGVVEEDVQGHLRSLFLDILDEDRNLHGSSDLLPDGGNSGGVGHQGVHGDAILDDQGRDGDQRQDQHVQDEELLSTGSCGIDFVTSNSPDHTFHTL